MGREGDNLYGSPRERADPEERHAQAQKIRAALETV